MSSERPATSALLGALLVQSGVISEEQLDVVLAEQAEHGGRVGDLLRERGWVTSRDLAVALAEQWGLEFVDLSAEDLDHEVAAWLSAEVARQHGAVPVRLDEAGRLLVALANPSDAATVTAIRSATAEQLRFVVADEAEVAGALARVYG